MVQEVCTSCIIAIKSYPKRLPVPERQQASMPRICFQSRGIFAIRGEAMAQWCWRSDIVCLSRDQSHQQHVWISKYLHNLSVSEWGNLVGVHLVIILSCILIFFSYKERENTPQRSSPTKFTWSNILSDAPRAQENLSNFVDPALRIALLLAQAPLPKMCTNLKGVGARRRARWASLIGNPEQGERC